MNSKLGSGTTMLQLPFIEGFSDYIKNAFKGKLLDGGSSSTTQNPIQMYSISGQRTTLPSVPVTELPLIVVVAVVLGVLAIFEHRKL